MNFLITLCEAGWDSILFTYTLPNSAVTYCEQYYKTLMLVGRTNHSFRGVLPTVARRCM